MTDKKTCGDIYIGESSNGRVYISKDAINTHIIVSGKSGSGKSTFLHTTEIDLARNGYTVVVLNGHNSHDNKFICEKLKEEHKLWCNPIDIKQSGIPFSMWKEDVSKQEAVFNAGSLFASVIKFGDMQWAVLNEMLGVAYDIRSEYSDEVEALKKCIQLMENKEKRVVCSIKRKLQAVLSLIRIMPKNVLKSGNINIFNISEYDFKVQKLFSELIIAMLWQTIKTEKFQARKEKIVIVIDEFQYLGLKDGTVLADLFRESRKYGVSLVLATQNFLSFKKEELSLMEQAATMLYFRQAEPEIPRICKDLRACIDDEYQIYELLKSLDRGYFLTKGEVLIKKRISGKTQIRVERTKRPVLTCCKI